MQPPVKRLVVIGLIVVGVLCIAVSVVYFTSTADALPAFFPGHQAGVSRHHTKHGIAMIGLAVVCWAGAWMVSGSGASGEKSGAGSEM